MHNVITLFSLTNFLLLCADLHFSSSLFSSVIKIFRFLDICFVYLKYILCLNQFFLSSAACLNCFSSYFLSSHNYTVISSVTSGIFIVNVSSLFKLLLDKSSVSCEAAKFKILFCADLHCSSGLLSPVINRFCSFEKYNRITK